MSREATMLRWRREVRLLRLPPASGSTKHIYGLGQRGFCLVTPTASQSDPLAEREDYSGSRPRNSTVPPGGRSKRRADLLARRAALVTPARDRPVRCWLGRRAAVAKSLRCLRVEQCQATVHAPGRQLVIVRPAHRAAGQSRRARSGTVTHGSIADLLSRKERVPKIALSCGFLGGVRPGCASVRPCSSTARGGVGSGRTTRTGRLGPPRRRQVQAGTQLQRRFVDRPLGHRQV